MPGSIEAIGLHKSYGRVRALRGLSESREARFTDYWDLMERVRLLL